uniref:Putative transposase n=1 Tax=Caulobacter sp. (strain K31) TaxID=366602 RepID=B0SXP6_CAUSK
MSDDEAYAAFRAVRFADNGGEAYCAHCGCDAVYEYAARRIFKCKACEKQFSLTSGTIFASRKLAIRDILTAIALFVNGANGHAALRMGRDLNVSYKTAFVLLHKLREVMGSLKPKEMLTGQVEIDGVWVGGHVKGPNLKIEQKERRRKKAGGEPEYPPKNEAKRFSVVTMRERREGGRSLSFVFKSESQGVKSVLENVDPAAEVITDGGPHWGQLVLRYANTSQVNHSIGHVIDGVHINGVEGFNSRIRRGERGVHHHIAGRYLQFYADEFAWRDDHRRVSNGQQFQMVLAAAARHPVSGEWKGFWQRRKAGAPARAPASSASAGRRGERPPPR